MAEETQAPPGVTEDMLAHQAALRIMDDTLKFESGEPETEPAKTPEPAPVEEPATEEPATEPATEEPAPSQEVPAQKAVAEIPLDQLDAIEMEITVDGQPKKVPIAELRKGYQLAQASYARMQEAAKIRDSMPETLKAEIAKHTTEYGKKLEIFTSAVAKIVAPELNGVNLVELAQTDPARWAALQAKQQQLSAFFQAAQQEHATLAQQREQETKALMAKQAAESVETLRDPEKGIAGWNDDLYSKILKTGESYGFSSNEVNAIVDHRLIKVMNDARQWRDLQAAKPSVEKRVTLVPKVVKPGTAAEKSDPNVEAKAKAMAKLRRSHSDEDARAVARHFFD